MAKLSLYDIVLIVSSIDLHIKRDEEFLNVFSSKELRNTLFDRIDILNNIKQKLIDLFLEMEE